MFGRYSISTFYIQIKISRKSYLEPVIVYHHEKDSMCTILSKEMTCLRHVPARQFIAY